ncbi:MAG: energy transducer TonB [Longimicrobiales bacterium]|nr:energy transducer TonB [Longimicrobiales bacterium]
MTKANDPLDADFRATLPADLQDLDRELSGIRIEERPSFGPELERELLHAWQNRQRPGSRATRPWIRTLLAAALAGLMIAGVSVPNARAAVREFVRTVVEEARGIFAPGPVADLQLPEVEVREALPVAPEPMTGVVVSAMDASDEVEEANPDFPTLPAVEITFPELISRAEAAAMIASYYPLELQQAGVEGEVKLLFWVDAQGIPENIQQTEGSGNPRLDYAAMLAARELRFRPATRNGTAVGTWVEVGVHFFALSGAGIVGLDSAGAGV